MAIAGAPRERGGVGGGTLPRPRSSRRPGPVVRTVSHSAAHELAAAAASASAPSGRRSTGPATHPGATSGRHSSTATGGGASARASASRDASRPAPAAELLRPWRDDRHSQTCSAATVARAGTRHFGPGPRATSTGMPGFDRERDSRRLPPPEPTSTSDSAGASGDRARRAVSASSTWSPRPRRDPRPTSPRRGRTAHAVGSTLAASRRGCFTFYTSVLRHRPRPGSRPRAGWARRPRSRCRHPRISFRRRWTILRSTDVIGSRAPAGRCDAHLDRGAHRHVVQHPLSALAVALRRRSPPPPVAVAVHDRVCEVLDRVDGLAMAADQQPQIVAAITVAGPGCVDSRPATAAIEAEAVQHAASRSRTRAGGSSPSGCGSATARAGAAGPGGARREQRRDRRAPARSPPPARPAGPRTARNSTASRSRSGYRRSSSCSAAQRASPRSRRWPRPARRSVTAVATGAGPPRLPAGLRRRLLSPRRRPSAPCRWSLARRRCCPPPWRWSADAGIVAHGALDQALLADRPEVGGDPVDHDAGREIRSRMARTRSAWPRTCTAAACR